MNSATTGLTAQQWFQAAQNAAAVKPDDPRYPRAQAVIASARQTILSRAAAQHLTQMQTMGPGTAQTIGQGFSGPQTEAPQTGAFGSFAEHFGHGASLGFSDELGGAVTALMQRQPGETTRQAYERGLKEQRDYLAASSEQHGTASLLGELGGTAATSTLLNAGVLKALPGAGAAFGAAEGAPFLARLAASTALGATEGGVIGAASGAGNADEGNRLLGGTIGGIGGAIIGGGTAGAFTGAAKGFRMIRSGLAPVRGGISTVAAPVPDAGTTTGPEAVLRSALAKMGKSPAEIDEAVTRTQARFGPIGARPVAPEAVARQPTGEEVAGFIPRQADSAPAMGLGGRPSVEATPPAPIQPAAAQVAPVASQSVGRPVVRGPGAASVASSPDAMWRELLKYPLTPEIQGEMGPALRGMDRGTARQMMAHVAQADAFGSISAPWRDFLLTHLQQAGSGR